MPSWFSGGSLLIKRDDLIHPIISGNKARKLSRLIEQADPLSGKHLMSMGGNHSNFLHALGYFCFKHKIQLTAFIRGEKPQNLSSTLRDLEQWGVQLEYVSRAFFRHLRNDPQVSEELAADRNAHWLPEGGSNVQALDGVMAAVEELSCEPDTILVPVGTGCTALGIALGILKRGWKSRVVGVVVLKGAESLSQTMSQLTEASGSFWPDNLTLNHDYCGKGFGKISLDIQQAQDYFQKLWSVPLDPVYTVKMCQALKGLCEQRLILRNESVMLWHTGGLQGN